MLPLSDDYASQSCPDEYRVLVGQFRDALNVYEANEKDEDYKRNMRENRRTDKIARFMELVDGERAADPQLVDPLVWVSKMTPTWGSKEPLMSTLGDQARRMLVRHHIEHKRIGFALPGLMFLDAGSQAAEALFREARQEPAPRCTRTRLLLAGDVPQESGRKYPNVETAPRYLECGTVVRETLG